MAGGPPFTDREVFIDALGHAASRSGGPYQDVATIYGDMSRLVVAWLARAEPGQLRQMYAELGWRGSPNVVAMHEAAKSWMEQHRRSAS